MKINEISITYGRTQSLKDYSNVKQSITVTATREAGESAIDVAGRLLDFAKHVVHDAIDSALEAADEKPMFYQGPLFCVRFAVARKIVVIYPENTDLPSARNWRDSDGWIGRYGWAAKRKDTAIAVATEIAAKKGYQLIDCTDGDFSRIPEWPDPGPEPEWYAKGLQSGFRQLGVEATVWEELARLSHVTAPYLLSLYRQDAEQKLTAAELIDLIRSGNEMDLFDDEDEDEDEEDEDF